MRVEQIKAEKKHEYCELSARVALDRSGRDFNLFYRFPADLADWLQPSADPFIAALLLPSMRINEKLSVAAPASKKLFATLPRIMHVYGGFHSRFRPVEVVVEGNTEFVSTPAKSKAAALFFSGGLDSFYSLLRLTEKQTGRLSHLILVKGFDISLDNSALFNMTYAAARDVADRYGMRLVAVSTNLRHLTRQFVHWDLSFGGALVSIALSLGGFFRRVYIASDLLPDKVYPAGSRPDLDPLWSTETTVFIHHGNDVLRSEKVRVILKEALARKHLRVCWENRGGAYNCGTCMKCVLTMIDIHLARATQKVDSFPTELSADLIRQTNLNTESNLILDIIKKQMADLRQNGEDELANALGDALRTGKYRHFVTTIWLRFRNILTRTKQ